VREREREMSEVRLYRGDARILFRMLKDKSQDLILTDPPYDITTKDLKFKPLTNATKEIFVKNFKRVLKPTGNVVIFCGFRDKFTWHNLFRKYRFTLISEIIVVYPAGLKIRKRFLPAHESALHFVLSEDYYFNDEVMMPDVYNTKRPRGICRNYGYDYHTAPSEKMRVTPKPLGLVQKLVEILSPEDGEVLDCFMGTGTTAEACVLTGRNFTGFEIDTELYKFAVERVKKAKNRMESGFHFG